MDEFPPIEATDEEIALLNELLADESMWAEPSPGLEDRVVTTIEHAAAAETMDVGDDLKVVDLGAAREKKRSRVAQIAPWVIAVAAVFAAVMFATQPFDRGSSRDFTVALAATPLAPGAHADGDLTNTNSGVEIKLDVTGLPRAPAGTFYQAWVKGANGLVPIGTFHTGGDVTLWSGVDMKQYPAMTVTIEPEDGNPASSGRRVLAGPIVPS